MNINSIQYGRYRVSDDGKSVVLANTKSGRAWTLTEQEKAYLYGEDIFTKEQLAEEIEMDRLFDELPPSTPY